LDALRDKGKYVFLQSGAASFKYLDHVATEARGHEKRVVGEFHPSRGRHNRRVPVADLFP